VRNIIVISLDMPGFRLNFETESKKKNKKEKGEGESPPLYNYQGRRGHVFCLSEEEGCR